MSEPGQLVLVTGANGFVGSHLVDRLLASGYRVRCMVRRTSDLSYVDGLPVEWAYADLEDRQALQLACDGVDAVCHCAALTRAVDEETFYRVNTRGTALLAEACLEVSPGLRRFLFVSSHTAAGPSRGADDILDEADEPRPITWYGRSKWAAEEALLALANCLPLTIVRPAAVFGPRDRDFFTYFALVKRGLSLLLGSRERRISLIYVHDLVELLLLALENGAATGQTYYGCAQAHTYAEFSAAVAQALGKSTLQIRLPEAVLSPMALWARVQCRLTGDPPLLNEQRICDMRQPYWLCSAEKARRELGFVPQHDLATAVQETAAWYRDSGWL